MRSGQRGAMKYISNLMTISPFQASKKGPKGRSKSSRKDNTNESPPALLVMEVESRAVMVKLARFPAVIIDRATPVTTEVDAHVMLAKSKDCANECEISPNMTSRHTRPGIDCKPDRRFIVGASLVENWSKQWPER